MTVVTVWLLIVLTGMLTPSSDSASLSFLSAPTSSPTIATCTVCPNPYDSITLPNATIPIFGTCGDLIAAIGFFTQDSNECRLIHSVSSLCGCPVSESSCFLCNDHYNGLIDASRPVPYLLEAPGVNVTCEIAQAYLHSIEASDPTCSLTKSLVGPYCGCPSSSLNTAGSTGNGKTCSLCQSGKAVANRTVSTGIDLPFLKTCGDLENIAKTYWQDGTETCQAVQALGTYCGCETSTSASHCTFCSNGSAVPISNQTKTIPFFKDKFNFAGMVPTCGLVDAAVQSLSSSDPSCSNVQLFGSYCGCPAIPNYCTYCSGNPDDHVTTPDKVVNGFSRISGLDGLTCSDIMFTAYQVSQASTTCLLVRGKAYVCGCNHGQYDYLGSNSIAKKRGLVWIPRFTAFLSVCGAIYILQDVYRNHRTPKLDQYHELVGTMSIFDFLGSFATMFTTLPIPRYDQYGDPSGIYGAWGNQATCTAQGFFVQLGYTGIFYNFALSIFYVLVVIYNYRDRDLKRVRKFFHIPAVVGIGLAFAGIPFYDNFIWLCQIPSRPIIESYRYMFIFVFYPIVIAILGSGVAISMVYLKVRKISHASRRWTFAQQVGHSGGGASLMARRVFWQAFFFVLALYGTWPLLMVAEFSSTTVITIYYYHWVWVLTLAIAPLQGFFNFFVYTRPKMMSYFKQVRRRRERRQPPVTRSGSWARRAMRRPLPADFFDSSSSDDDDDENKSVPPEVHPLSNDNVSQPATDSIHAPVDPDQANSTRANGTKRMMRMPSLAESGLSRSTSSAGRNSPPPNDVMPNDASIPRNDSLHAQRGDDNLDETLSAGTTDTDD